MAASLAWAWIIETLADFKPPNSHLLQSLMSFAPDLSTDSSEIARERVSLRILEEMLDLVPADGTDSIGTCSGGNVQIDVSERAVDVLFKLLLIDAVWTVDSPSRCLSIPDLFRKVNLHKLLARSQVDILVLNIDFVFLELFYFSQSAFVTFFKSVLVQVEVEEVSQIISYLKVTTSDLTRGVELKHALNQFILKKRACLPKHALELLKELILEGGHPSAPSLMERSGLAKESRANCLDSGRIPADGIGEDETSKRLKAINNIVEIPSLEQNLSTEVLENGNTNFQEGAHNQISRYKLVDKDRELLLADKVTSNDEKAHPVKLTTQPPDDSGKMPLEAQQNGVHKTMHLQQDIHESICVDEAHDEGSEPSETSSRGFGDRNTNLNYNLDDEMVANEKRQFISSQNIASRNSQAGNWTEQSCCIKCDEGGQLLICSGSSCPMAVHEDCLGSPASFEGTDFYCPFCSYTRANAAYRKAKQKIAIARKALSSFMCRDLAHAKQPRQLPEGAYNKESEAARNAKCPDTIHANKQHREIIDNHISTRVIEYRQQEKASIHLSDNNLPCKEAATSLDSERNGVPLVQEKEGTSITVDSNKHKTAVEPHHDVVVATFCSNDYLPCKEVETSVIMKRHDVSSIDVERNCVEIVKDSQCMREGEHQQQKESPTLCNNDSLPCREAKTSFDSESQNVIDEKEDAADMVDNQQHMNDSTQHRRAETGTNSNAGNIPCIQVDDSPAAEKRPRVKRKHAMIQQTSDPETPATQPSINADETARNQNAEDLSPNKRIKRRKAAKRYSNPLMPHSRRTKLLWTSEEEAVLKEAVRKFSEPGQGSLPWTKIMDFGNKVFHKTRTPGDLKDKWRNIMIKEGAPRRKT